MVGKKVATSTPLQKLIRAARSSKRLAKQKLATTSGFFENTLDFSVNEETVVEAKNMPKDLLTGGSNGGDLQYVPNTTPYKIVVTWVRPFDGTKEGYVRFSEVCDKAFKSILSSDYSSLMFYVLSFLNPIEYPFTHGVCYSTWQDLKKALDEHFEIRLDEKSLFREIMNLKKKDGETLYAFYARLLSKCFDYGVFLRANLSDALVIDTKIAQAEDYVLETFIRSVG